MTSDMPDPGSGGRQRAFDLVIFDCDGVLVDSEILSIRLDVELLAKLGWPLTREEIIERWVGRTDAAMRAEIEEHLGNYLLTVTLINVGVGIGTGLICALTGMPNPAGLGALAATLNFIPIIGPVAMFAVLVVVGLVAFPTISGGLMAALAFGGLTFLEGHFITPTIIGRRLALNALAVLLALAFWTWMWGPMGAFLSSPLLIVALILKEHLMPVDAPQLPQG